jgi:hypothetical protein
MLFVYEKHSRPGAEGSALKPRRPAKGCKAIIVCALSAVLMAVLPARMVLGQAARPVDFDRDIRPIFRTSCYSCHQGANASAQLRLDSKESALKGGASGRVILPGNSRQSPLMQRLTSQDRRVRMPFGLAPLAPEKIKLIGAWIDQGAPWPEQASVEKHWAYVKPQRPALPAVRNASWVRNPIDRFVLARLEKEGLAPSPEASRETLIRRVSLDLTGLPPTLEEIDAFLADRSPDASEKVVDRLLASPHYGERWASRWLDLARYADTNGYEADRRRSIWKYRDWVIQAFNRDMPFDEFTVEQIAGDMLPHATEDQRIATGFHRNSMFNEEGGVDPEQSHWETLVDRVNTTATVWLGTTLGCAQCHDHKYDPFTQREYYQFMAFFNNTEYKVQGDSSGTQRYVEPQLDLPTPEQETRRKELQAEIEKLEARLASATPELAREQSQWEQAVAQAPAAWRPLAVTDLRATGGAVLSKAPDGSILAGGANPREVTYTIEARSPLESITGIRLEALPDASLPRGGPGRDAYGNFLLTAFELEAGDSPEHLENIALPRVFADNGNVKDKKFSQLWVVDASREETRLPRQIVFVPQAPVRLGGQSILRITLRQNSAFLGQGIGRFRISVTAAPDPQTIVNITHKLRPLLQAPESSRTEEQKKELAGFYRSVAPSLEPARKRLAALRKSLANLGIVSTLVLQERPLLARPAAYVRVRGNFLNKGDLAYANVPAVLPPLPESELPTRLGLARWLVSRENPLTARVTVNRFWEQCFGRGIVETSEDFGTQGERPTHPELLDWLAVEFMDRNWKMKPLIRLIVTSATYRQSSRAGAALLERDPYNRLLARGPRFRMEAEMIRDTVLAASGLLSPKIGGPSVFPPQPEGIWNMPYNNDKWVESQGEDRHRRGLYTFWRRTAPYPSLLVFDATSREVCTARRVRTNTPLQALTTLNDPAFFEAAQALARRIVARGGLDPRSRAIYGFRLCTGRRPDPAELDRLLSGYEKEIAFFRGHPEDTAKLAGPDQPELAAWTMVGNVLLNLDETLTKE